jgi:hypothetical protein
MPDACVDPKEDSVTERFDGVGARWVKVYVGGGLHFVNWVEQYKEVYGEANVVVEEIFARESSCYAQAGEKLFRIWVKQEK